MTLDLDEDQAREIARLRGRTKGARCAVIGAVAIGHHLVLPRQTRDVDLVIELGEEELTELLTGLAWKRDPRQQQRWTGGGNFVADVLPASPFRVAEPGAIGSVRGRCNGKRAVGGAAAVTGARDHCVVAHRERASDPGQ